MSGGPMSDERRRSIEIEIDHDYDSACEADICVTCWLADLLAEMDRLAAENERLTRWYANAERIVEQCEAQGPKADAHRRENRAWREGVGAFVDEFVPTYCSEAACGPADLLPALEDLAERLRADDTEFVPGDRVTQGDGMRSLDTQQPMREFDVQDVNPETNELLINGHWVPAQSYRKADG